MNIYTNTTSFHEFCKVRMITETTEKKFIEYFSVKFRENFIGGEEILDFLLNNMTQNEIQRHWVNFIKEYKKEIMEDMEKEELRYGDTIKHGG